MHLTLLPHVSAGVEKGTGRVLVTVNPRYFRPTEVDLLLGNPAKARSVLGWKPTRDIDAIIDEMMTHDMKSVPSMFSRQ